MRVRGLSTLLAVAVLGAIPAARAQVPTEPTLPPAPVPASAPAPAGTPLPAPPSPPDPSTYALAWVRDEGAETCPPGRDLARDVATRLGRSPFDEDSARSIEIRVERTATGFRSRVHVRGSDGSVLGRRLLASDEPSCAPLFEATALAVALLIDPDAELRATSATGVATFVEPEPPPAPAPAPPPPPPPTDTPRSFVEAGTETFTYQHEIASTSALVAYAAGITPGSTPGASLHVNGRPSQRWGWAVTALYLDPSEAASDEVSFSVGLTAVGAFATFRPLTGGTILSLEAGPWLGVLGTSVLAPVGGPPDIIATSPGDFLYAALSAGVGLEAHVSTHVFLTARGALLLPLVRRQLSVSVAEPTGSSVEVVWTQPALSALLSAGLGFSFF